MPLEAVWSFFACIFICVASTANGLSTPSMLKVSLVGIQGCDRTGLGGHVPWMLCFLPSKEDATRGRTWWMKLGWFWWQECLDIRFLMFEMQMESVVYTWAWISDPTKSDPFERLNIGSGEAWGISVGLLWKLWMYVREDLLGYAAAHELDSQRNHCCNSTALS